MSGRMKAEEVHPKKWEDAYRLIDDGMTPTEAARQLNLPLKTLVRRYDTKKLGVSKRGPAPMMGTRGEKALLDWLLLHEHIGKCVTMDQFRELGKRIAGDLGIEGFKAGREWEEAFFRRHTERNRLYAIHPLAIKEYFAALKPHVEKRSADKLWGADEWGFDLMNLHQEKVSCALHQIAPIFRVSLAAIESFRKRGDDLFTIGAHASHVEQPFDIAAAKPRSANVRRAIDMVRLGTPGVPGVSVTMDKIMSPIRDGFHKTMAPLFDSKTGKSISIPSIAFKKAGIFPWNPNLTDEELFGPAVYFDDAVVKARPSPPLPSSPVKLAAVKKHTAAVIEAGDIDAALSDVVKRKHKPAVPGCTLLTGDEYTAVVVSEANVKLAKEDAISVKRVATAKAKAEKLAAIERGEVPKKRKYVKKAKPIAAAAFSALDIALPIPPAKRQKKKA